MKRYAYLITKTDEGRDPDRRVMSRGAQDLEDTADPRAFAEDALQRNRTEHSYYTGPRRCSYWPTGPDQPLPRTAPDHAEHIEG